MTDWDFGWSDGEYEPSETSSEDRIAWDDPDHMAKWKKDQALAIQTMERWENMDLLVENAEKLIESLKKDQKDDLDSLLRALEEALYYFKRVYDYNFLKKHMTFNIREKMIERSDED